MKSQLGKQAPLEEKIESEIIPDVDNNALQILFDREIGNPHRASAFQKEYMKIKAHKPRIWSYGPTSCADGAVEEIITCIQTEEGLKRANIIVWGDSKGFLGVSEVFRPGFTDDRSPIEEPKCIFPCSQELTSVSAYLPPCLAPVHLSRKSSSKITAIKKLKTINEVDNESLIYTTLGSGFQGGTLHIFKCCDTDDGFDQQILSATCAVMDCSVWTASYASPEKATLGTSEGAAVVELERSVLRWLIRSQSDILSQECDLQGNLVFCGFRNGYISMIDMRAPSSMPKRMPSMHDRSNTTSSVLTFSKARSKKSEKGNKNLIHAKKENRPFRDKATEIAKNFTECMRMNSAVCSLLLLRSDESYLLASAMNGDIYLWDRRHLGKGPVLTYKGNQNSYLPLCLGVDASEALLASGGEDAAVRIWSLHSGKLLQIISQLPAIVYNFSTPTNSTSLSYAGAGCHAWKMWLGTSAGVMYLHG
ncbi:hypothetical protein KP509_03G072100 [Ceratopteris richardii]|uniref:Uncharacterized protein n=1 Tax=Ceratopteris richardii TaxID=49495 RepID=A0A8T2V814_CERRI|nr:hypothetical protein KP509_03G072100 [Ceratopteris richardii]